MRLTRIFPPNIKPVHIGVYSTTSRRSCGFRIYQHWNGESWGMTCSTIDEALREGTHIFRHSSIFQNNYWRGCTEKQS